MGLGRATTLSVERIAARVLLGVLGVFAVSAVLFTGLAQAQGPQKETPPQAKSGKETGGELAWEMPGRVSIYDLQFGAADIRDNQMKFLGNTRTFNADLFKNRLTLMVRFSFAGSMSEIPLKFIIKLPDSRQHEETVRLHGRRGNYRYHFTIHNPMDFLGTGSVYLYYGFSIVDVLDFTIVPGS